MYITILVKQVYCYISQVSGERLQDHWSSGLGLVISVDSVDMSTPKAGSLHDKWRNTQHSIGCLSESVDHWFWDI